MKNIQIFRVFFLLFGRSGKEGILFFFAKVAIAGDIRYVKRSSLVD